MDKHIYMALPWASLRQYILTFLVLLLLPTYSIARTNSLESIQYDRLPGDEVQITMSFSSPPPTPLSFTISNPARIALDFPGTRNALAKRSQPVRLGPAQSISTAQAKDRTRVVVNLSEMVKYQTEAIDNKIRLTLAPTPKASATFVNSSDRTSGFTTTAAPSSSSMPVATNASTNSSGSGAPELPGVSNIDFRRSVDGSGRILIRLTDASVPVTVKQEGTTIMVDLRGAYLPERLRKRIDVIDFATPVRTMDATSTANGAKLTIKTHGNFTHLGYQSDDLYTVEVRPASKTTTTSAKDSEKQISYKGEKLSLNFQDIEVRSVLQLIADFTGLNVVVSDSVSGNLTLRLKNVPWDQALDIIMKTKGLDKRERGNVLYIAPAEEISEQEQKALLADKQVEDLAPLRTEIITLNYSDAKEMAQLLRAAGSGGNQSHSILSSRGSVTLDRRTNNLLIKDTAAKLEEVRDLIKTLDVPVRQVMIESRIVTARDTFTHELGVNFSASNTENDSDQTLTTDFQVNLPSTNAAGSIGLALAKIPLGAKLDLELSAAQIESRAEIVASPRIITSNKTTARIEQGVEIPFEEATSSGATNIAFKKAVLSLEVTPHITKDDRISMDLTVSRDSVGQLFKDVPSIDTREVQTQVLVQNGQTIVLGGIFEEDNQDNNRRIPFFSDIPIIGKLFRRDQKKRDKSELLIFVTPKIINESLSLR